MVEKLNAILKDLKEHDSTLFQPSGLALRQGETFFHSLNVKPNKCLEAKLTKIRKNIEAPENKKRSYDGTFKGGHTQIAHQQKEKEKRKPQKA